jgi:hypothetical protein
MDLFLAACQGLGLALAAGIVTGAVAGAAPEGARGLIFVLLVAGALGAALAFGASLESEDHSAWPGWPVGAAVALPSFGVARSVVAGARSRAGSDSTVVIAGTVAIVGLVLAGLSLLIAPFSLVFLLGLVVLSLRRRRRAAEKYEGLRSLR